jgi:hypothetical protein
VVELSIFRRHRRDMSDDGRCRIVDAHRNIHAVVTESGNPGDERMSCHAR